MELEGMKVYTDVDEFIKVYDDGQGESPFGKTVFERRLKEDGNLILMKNNFTGGYDSYCSFNKQNCQNNSRCSMYEECSLLYNNFLRTKKLERICQGNH